MEIQGHSEWKRALAALVIGAAFAWPAAAAARDTAPSAAALEVGTLPAGSSLQVDGDLSDPAWQAARVLDGFRQRTPREGAEATYPTEVRLIGDASALYVGVRMTDPEPHRIAGHLTRRDEPSPSDWIRVIVDSFNDRRTAYEFAVNPAGVKQDRYWFNDGDEDRGWDAVWEVVAVRTETGWQAEFRIPYSQLRFRGQHDGRVGLAVFREVARLNEVSSWPLVAQSRAGFVSQFDQVANISPASAPDRLELVPYAVSRATFSPSSDNPLVDTRDPDLVAGLDLKYAITPGLTLTATVNPDFGQVEADPAVVNLTAFETFFPERRPFFVEGSGNFRFDTDCSDGECTGLFYSRRIGRQPQAPADLDAGEYADAPAQTTIVGASKLTGKIGRFSIGVLHALTQEETASVWSPSLETSTQTVEPLTSYAVVRARREFADNSNVGFVFTATNRALDDRVRDVLPGQAYTGGIDVDWRLSPRYQVRGYWAASSVRGDPAALTLLQENSRHYYQRPDADYVQYDPSRDSLNGHSGEIAFGKNGGERLRYRTAYSYKSPGFDVNDLGYMRRADQRSISNWVQWRFPKPASWYRWVRVNFNQWAGWNYGGDLNVLGVNVNAHVQFPNNWTTGAGVSWNAEGLDDRLTRGGPGGLRPERRSVWYYVESDSRRRVTLNLFGFVGGDRYGQKDVEVNPSITVRPSSSLAIEPGLRVGRGRSATQWVDAVEDQGTRYVFGEIDQTTVALTLRVDYTIRPTLSLQIYAQPFVSAADYDNYKELVDGRAEFFGDRYRPYAYQGSADFRYSSLRTTNVLRWEYRPGSTLFVVWQQGREQVAEQGDFRFGRDVSGIFSSPAQNVFLVKFAYWFNL